MPAFQPTRAKRAVACPSDCVIVAMFRLLICAGDVRYRSVSAQHAVSARVSPASLMRLKTHICLAHVFSSCACAAVCSSVHTSPFNAQPVSQSWSLPAVVPVCRVLHRRGRLRHRVQRRRALVVLLRVHNWSTRCGRSTVAVCVPPYWAVTPRNYYVKGSSSEVAAGKSRRGLIAVL